MGENLQEKLGLTLLMNRKSSLLNENVGKEEERTEENEDENEEYSVDEPGERKCAILMMMNLIV